MSFRPDILFFDKASLNSGILFSCGACFMKLVSTGCALRSSPTVS